MSETPRADLPPGPAPEPNGRDLDLDVVKGFLVIGMVVYHSMNYFADVPAEVYGYLRFVNGSFVFITGYVVAALHAKMPPARRQARVRPLVARGAKLLAVFTVLNIAIALGGVTNYRHVTFGASQYLTNAGALYLGGETRQGAFRILVPISYVLMLSGVYLAASPQARNILVAATLIAALGYSIVFAVTPNAFFLLTGLVGVSTGMFVGPWLGRCVGLSAAGRARRHRRPRLRDAASIAIAFAGLAAVMNVLSGNVLTYSIGIASMLALAYAAARLCGERGRIYGWLVLMGKYSLVGYIGQIGFLFVLQRALQGHDIRPYQALAVAIVTVCGAVLGLCLLLERSRRGSPLIEKTYRLVFA